MNQYSVKIEVLASVDAFSEDDAKDYISDIFNVDDEIKSVKIIKISKNQLTCPNCASIIVLAPCPYGGIGRRSRLKICLQHWSVGSNPTMGTEQEVYC